MPNPLFLQNARWCLWQLILACACSGCIRSTLFDPSGNDITLAASWTIEGQPASEELCEAADVDRVVLAFRFEGLEYIDSRFNCRCDLAGFDSRSPTRSNGCSEARLAFGTYDVQWVFFNRRRDEVGRGEPFAIDATRTGPCASTAEDVLGHCDLPSASYP